MKEEIDKIRNIIINSGYNEDLANIIINMYCFINENTYIGGCHSCSSILYVALSEIGYKPLICIGEVKTDKYLFDHSWIELDKKVIDLPISKTLYGGMPASAPIILNINIKNNQETNIKYGVNGKGLDEIGNILLNTPFCEYMDNEPTHIHGLWDILEEIIGEKVNIKELREKYRDTRRVFRKDINMM